MHAVLIAGGTIVDGRGGEPYQADVAIDEGRIAAVGTRLGSSRRILDARGRIVCPGFVDIHTHSDFTIPVRPAAAAKLLQGVTTDCTGNCGFSPFPLAGDSAGGQHGAPT
jgi:N-acyl-D-amino-acid deacylase